MDATDTFKVEDAVGQALLPGDNVAYARTRSSHIYIERRVLACIVGPGQGRLYVAGSLGKLSPQIVGLHKLVRLSRAI